ncbi:hypothetical protein HDU85_007622 [Gaertneriomyces sp. JEL0708]|nr:hypothetical protein HDU85_007622 [Gaertneriomyces sp. JEL0708]
MFNLRRLPLRRLYSTIKSQAGESTAVKGGAAIAEADLARTNTAVAGNNHFHLPKGWKKQASGVKYYELASQDQASGAERRGWGKWKLTGAECRLEPKA